jgi:hypothetical protein
MLTACVLCLLCAAGSEVVLPLQLPGNGGASSGSGGNEELQSVLDDFLRPAPGLC